jgi:hypothetical protein
MRQVVEAVVAYAISGIAGEALTDAERQLGPAALRSVCLQLTVWWHGHHESQPPARVPPPLRFGGPAAWHWSLGWVMAAVPALGELLARNPAGVRFADEVGPDERAAIRDWARANYRPVVQT